MHIVSMVSIHVTFVRQVPLFDTLQIHGPTQTMQVVSHMDLNLKFIC